MSQLQLNVNVKIQVLELIKIINESKNLSVLYICMIYLRYNIFVIEFMYFMLEFGRGRKDRANYPRT